MIPIRLLASAGAAALLCAGVAGATAAAAHATGPAIRPDTRPDIGPDTATATSLVNGLGARLHVALSDAGSDPNGNLVFSPFSIGVALTMTAAGAAGDTAAEMGDVLGIGADDIHPTLGALVAGVTERGDGTFSAANSLWTQADLDIDPEFTGLLRDVYGSELMATDFAADPQGAVRAVNEWVAAQTDDRIPQLLTDQQVTALTRFILVNAVHLDADWARPFDPNTTRPEEFTRPDGSVVETDFMGQTAHLGYAGHDGTQAVVLEYAGGLEMVVVIPAVGELASFEAAVVDNGGDIDAVVGGFASTAVALRLPRWDIETRTGLVPQLEALGMTLPFADEADFSNITTDIPLVVADVVHQANITVDEAGTEAAAATAVIGEVAAAPGPGPEPVVVRADHPFFFAIRDSDTGTILFQGHVNDPSAR